MSDGQISKGRARSIAHVEYEVLQLLGREIDLSGLMSQMIPKGDRVAEKRFKTGATNISGYLMNMVERRKHRLPENHVDYEPKGDE